jgi:hypothetical protein
MESEKRESENEEEDFNTEGTELGHGGPRRERCKGGGSKRSGGTRRDWIGIGIGLVELRLAGEYIGACGVLVICAGCSGECGGDGVIVAGEGGSDFMLPCWFWA